jgi:hypothetical protein
MLGLALVVVGILGLALMLVQTSSPV